MSRGGEPAAEFQLQFLAFLQRLLDEGEFVATYKYALLMALADICVERGQDTTEALRVGTEQIAEKFIHYYWRQVQPFPHAGGKERELWQNTGRQARIVNLVRERSAAYGMRSEPPKLEGTQDRRLIRDVASTVSVMPLWKLQVLGGAVEDRLYENTGSGREVVLKPGISFCFRRFHGFVRRLAQDGWVDFVRKLRKNQAILGEGIDLGEFLFGSERASLEVYRPVLLDVQDGHCFYCSRGLRQSEVDHFIPWSRYSNDLGHNFVLACSACNNSKRDMLAARDHLEHWIERNTDRSLGLETFFDDNGLHHDLAGSYAVARWAYAQAALMDGLAWIRARETVRIDRSLLTSLDQTIGSTPW